MAYAKATQRPLKVLDRAMESAESLLAWLSRDLGIALQKCRGLSDSQVAFAVALGQMREQTQTPTRSLAKVPDPFISRYPQQLCGIWSLTPEGRAAQQFLDSSAVMHVNKMWGLMLFTWLGAGGTLGQAFQQLMAVPEMSNYRCDDRQPLEVINYAKLCVEHLDGHARQFFGSDGRDKSQRLGKSAEGMLAAWHEAVPALTKAFGKGTSSFMAALGRLPKAGPLAQKEICSYLGVSTHFSYMAEEIPFGPGAEKGARLFLQLEDHFLDGAKALRKRLEDCMLQHFPGLRGKSDLGYLSVVDIEIFCCYGYTYCCKFIQKLRERLKRPFCKVPYDEALELAEGFTTPTGWVLHVNGRPALEIELPAFSCASESKKPRLSSSLFSLGEDWRRLEQGLGQGQKQKHACFKAVKELGRCTEQEILQKLQLYVDRQELDKPEQPLSKIWGYYRPKLLQEGFLVMTEP